MFVAYERPIELLVGRLEIGESSGVLGPLIMEMATAVAIRWLCEWALLRMAMSMAPEDVLTLALVATSTPLPEE